MICSLLLSMSTNVDHVFFASISRGIPLAPYGFN